MSLYFYTAYLHQPLSLNPFLLKRREGSRAIFGVAGLAESNPAEGRKVTASPKLKYLSCGVTSTGKKVSFPIHTPR